jgi:L-iditol 2-dehydrogenase
MSTMILGAYADYIVIPERIVKRNAHMKPEHLSYIEAAFLEPLSCVVHSVEYLVANSKFNAGSALVAVIGNGAFGILHAQVLQQRNITPVIIGRNEKRSAIARELGIDVIDSRAEDPLEAIASRTQGRGADAVIECTGNPDVWQEAPMLVRRGGTVSFFGGLPASTQVAFQASRIHYDEVRLIGPFHLTSRSVRSAYELLRDQKIDVAPLVTQKYPLEAVADVFERLDRGEGMKFAIEP